MNSGGVSAEVWAVFGKGDVQETSPAEGQALIKMEVACSPTFLQYIEAEDDVLVNFARGYVRFRRLDFLLALASILPDLLQAGLQAEAGKGS